MNILRIYKYYLLMITVLLGISNAAFPNHAKSFHDKKNLEIIKFDVAEDATRFIFDTEPVDEDGFPAYGSSFITQGYIYPFGTLDGTNGVMADGQPEFPEKVIGTWTCRGRFIGDGFKTITGPIVITTQHYDLGKKPGKKTLASEGFELVDIDQAVKRAITGGTGPFKNARGEAVQTLLGFNASEGVNLRFKVKINTK